MPTNASIVLTRNVIANFPHSLPDIEFDNHGVRNIWIYAALLDFVKWLYELTAYVTHSAQQVMLSPENLAEIICNIGFAPRTTYMPIVVATCPEAFLKFRFFNNAEEAQRFLIFVKQFFRKRSHMFSLYEFLVGYQNHVLQDSTSDCEMNPRSNYMTFSITPAYALEQHPYSYRYQRWVENNCPVYLADNYLRRGSDIRGIFNNLTQAEMYTYLRMNVSHFRPTDEAFELMMKPYNWTALSQYILKNNTTMNSFIAVNESTTDVYASNYRGARFELLELQKHMHDAYQTRTHQTTRSDDTHGPQFILSTIYLISLSVVFFPIAFYCINKCTNGRAKIVANQFVELMARPFEKIGMLRRIPDANNPEDDPELETTTMIHHQ